MLNLLESAVKVVVGVVIETPVAVVSDVLTLGGNLTGNENSYTRESLTKVHQNLSDITEPDS